MSSITTSPPSSHPTETWVWLGPELQALGGYSDGDSGTAHWVRPVYSILNIYEVIQQNFDNAVFPQLK